MNEISLHDCRWYLVRGVKVDVSQRTAQRHALGSGTYGELTGAGIKVRKSGVATHVAGTYGGRVTLLITLPKPAACTDTVQLATLELGVHG